MKGEPFSQSTVCWDNLNDSSRDLKKPVSSNFVKRVLSVYADENHFDATSLS